MFDRAACSLIPYHTTFRQKRVKKLKNLRFFPLALLLCLLFALCAPGALALEPPQLTAQAVLLVDLESGVTLYEKNADAPRSPASLTKVMTILLTLEAVERGEVSLDDTVTAGADCRSGMRDDSSSVGISAGEELTLRDLLYCAAVASGNDACNGLAVYLAGSIPAFVERMNQKAGELGCEQTHFVDPHGLSYDDLTSARDLYRITREAMRHPAFMELCDTRAYTVPASNKSGERQLKSSNALIAPDGVYGAGYLYEGAHGVKTGYTRAAGYCLISTAQREGMRLMAIVLGCDGPYLSDTETRYSFVDSAKLYDWAFSGFTLRCLLSEYDLVGSAPVTDGREEQVGLRPLRSVFAPLPKDADPAGLTLSLRLYDEPLTAPLRAGQVLGQVQVLYAGQVLVTEELAAAAPVPLRFWLRLARALTD